MSADQTTRAERKERYHAVLRTVGHNTTEVQHCGARPETVKLILVAHGQYSVDGVERSIRAAVERDDLCAWRDDEGQRRLTLATKADLRRVAAYWHERGDQRQLAWINKCIAEVRDG